MINEVRSRLCRSIARNTYQLLQLQPGVQGVGGSDLFYGSDKPGAVSVNGGRGRSNNFSVNGGDGNDLFVNSPGIEPSPDAIQEFKVITNTFDAEYGRNSGAVINVVTKSGTNQFHGTIYDYVRNSIFDAKGYFNLTKPDDTQNQFGATIGGPSGKTRLSSLSRTKDSQLVEGIASDRTASQRSRRRASDNLPALLEPFRSRPSPTSSKTAPAAPTRLAPRAASLLRPATPWASIFPAPRFLRTVSIRSQPT